MPRYLTGLALSAAALAGVLHAQERESIGVEELRAGMTGYGESVFVGEETERFEVEVLGVVRDIAPGSSIILGRLTGRNLERTGVVAGMSGSPVWIDGRLAGAVAFSWPFSQEAIAGITPIEAMREIPSSGSRTDAIAPRTVTFAEIAGRSFRDDLWSVELARLTSPLLSRGRSAAVWAASGFAGTSLAALEGVLPALAPVSGRSDSSSRELGGGSSIAVLFIDGDLRMAATGTVTERVGERILAFGHSVAHLGGVAMPMAPAEVVTVVGSDYSSFKIANSGAAIGAFEKDHWAGLAGTIGAQARVLPLSVAIAGPMPASYEMRLARVPDLVAVLASVASLGALESVTAAAGVRSLDLGLVIKIAGRGDLELHQSFDGPGAANRAVSFLLAVVDYLARSDLAEVDLEALRVEMTPHAEPLAARVVSAHARDLRVAPGAQTEIVVELRGYRGELERQIVPIEIPREASAGRYVVLVGDGASLDGARLALEPFEPQSFDQALRLLASLSSSRELVVLGLAPALGTRAGGEALPRLPPSVSAIWAGSVPTDRPLRTGIVRRVRFDQARPLSGVARVDFEIVSPETAAAGPPDGAGGGRNPKRRPGQ